MALTIGITNLLRKLFFGVGNNEQKRQVSPSVDVQKDAKRVEQISLAETTQNEQVTKIETEEAMVKEPMTQPIPEFQVEKETEKVENHLMNDFIKYCIADGIKENTAKRYSEQIVEYAASMGKDMAQLTEQDIQQYIMASPKTVKAKALKRFIKFKTNNP
ncbi:MAG: phage integrase N-terminal SAM-like domain-containing protein [Nitrososphaerales archaeon]